MLFRSVFCSVVGWAHIDIAKFGSASFCRFQIETIVANETEDDAVAIDTVVAEHLFDHDFASPFALVGDILYKIRIACHDENFCKDSEKGMPSQDIPQFIKYKCVRWDYVID